MRVTIVNPVWDEALATAEAMLERYTTLSGWAEAVRSSSDLEVTVCQRFSSNARIDRRGVHYRFHADRKAPSPHRGSSGSRSLIDEVLSSAPDVVHINGLLFPELIRSVRASLPRHVALVAELHRLLPRHVLPGDPRGTPQFHHQAEQETRQKQRAENADAGNGIRAFFENLRHQSV